MATTEEIEKYCRNCLSRDFVNEKGLVCNRTRRKFPHFEEECENFENDEELEKWAPPKPEDFPVYMTREELLAEENLPKGLMCGVARSYWGSGMGIDFGIYRLSNWIYGHRYRILCGFCHAPGKGDTSNLWNLGCCIGSD